MQYLEDSDMHMLRHMPQPMSVNYTQHPGCNTNQCDHRLYFGSRFLVSFDTLTLTQIHCHNCFQEHAFRTSQ